jgi:hypothetical protein
VRCVVAQCSKVTRGRGDPAGQLPGALSGQRIYLEQLPKNGVSRNRVSN